MDAFGRGLSDKPWLIALNKIDLLTVEKEAVKVSNRWGVETYRVSARTGEGVEQWLEAVWSQARLQGDPAPAEDETISPKLAVRQRVEVVRTSTGFRVRGERAEEAVVMLGVASEEARAELARRLRRMGALAALRRAGVQAGDSVRIGAAGLEWPL